MSINHTAIHEAGHALAHIRFDILQSKATIVGDGECLGSVLADDSNWSKEEAADQIIALCAGYGALRIFGHEDQSARLGADNDFDEANRLIDFWGLGDLEEWLQKVVTFLDTPENRKAIEMIASELQKHQTLGGNYMGVLVEYSDGDTSETEWKNYVEVILPSFGKTPSTDY